MSHKPDDPDHRGRNYGDDNAGESLRRHPQGSERRPIQLADSFARARDILAALVKNTRDGDTLIVATDSNGFPVTQKVIQRRGESLPHALVIGRHNRCALTIPNDSRVSLRHILLTARYGANQVRLRGYDLGGRAGIVLADGKRVPGFSALDHVALTFGQTGMFVLPGGRAGERLLEGTIDQAFRRITGISPDGAGVRLAQSAMAEPSVAQIGGYRPVHVDARPRSWGVLRLRSLKGKPDRDNQRTLEVDEEQLNRGLLIGRYSDRCSLAGAGRNLSRVHALVTRDGSSSSLLVYDLASTNGVRPGPETEGPSHAVVRLRQDDPVMLGHFELSWVPAPELNLH